MTARFPSMIGIMRNSIKTGSTFCTVPVNSLCIRVLTILRDNGFIFGYSFISHQLKSAYPRVRISFKYTDNNSSILRDLSIFKNTKSNFLFMHGNKQYQILSHNKLYLLTRPEGLLLTSFGSLYSKLINTNRRSSGGKLLLELLI